MVRTGVGSGLLELVFDQVRDDLGVGFADELVAARDEGLLEREVVLDDAVVHHDEGAGAVAVRVRVLLSGAAVCGPARVADAVGAVQRLVAQHGFQVAQLAGGAAHVEFGGVHGVTGDGDAGRIVAAVFQTTQAFDDEGDD